MTVLERALAERINLLENHYLAKACRTCGITVEDTTSGKKHINKILNEGVITYIYADEKLALVQVFFTDAEIKFRRIKRLEFWKHKLSKLFRLWA
jgi:hypothetical protein